MLLKESGHNVGAERERDTTIVFAPSCDVFIRIRPEQIAQEAAVRNLENLVSDLDFPRSPQGEELMGFV